jgi:hypothetical protein
MNDINCDFPTSMPEFQRKRKGLTFPARFLHAHTQKNQKSVLLPQHKVVRRLPVASRYGAIHHPALIGVSTGKNAFQFGRCIPR